MEISKISKKSKNLKNLKFQKNLIFFLNFKDFKKYSEIRGATGISDAFIVSDIPNENEMQATLEVAQAKKYRSQGALHPWS